MGYFRTWYSGTISAHQVELKVHYHRFFNDIFTSVEMI